MQTKSGQRRSLSRFIRNNLALIIIIMCLLAITAIIIVAGIESNQPVLPVDTNPADDGQTVVNPPEQPQPPDDGSQPQQPEPPQKETFGLPVVAEFQVGMDYTTGEGDNMFVFNSTLNRYESHRAVDFLVPAGSDVVSLKSGNVTQVGSSYGMGNYVIVDHGDGVVATYASLDNVGVTAGQYVAKGQVLGKASESASYEFVQGAHVHLSITENTVTVNPWEYINDAKSGTLLTDNTDQD